MTTWRAARRIAAKDLRIELRTRDVLTAMGMFALLIVVVASFAFPTSGAQREPSPPACCGWPGCSRSCSASGARSRWSTRTTASTRC
jgi:hypothetical protein